MSLLGDKFKLGITSDPMHRFLDAPYAYKRSGFRTMTVLGVARSLADISSLETKLISEFRSDPRCLNKSSGGENPQLGAHGLAFLYVVQ